ncbi:spermatogenesis-associated protein 2-like protein [Hoplias malabaricus]|uniref:spermatogenesis-associated protein 2-like protein n=1 Tax=Hoplias malabaricus TaxID=27720 RepID=UPI0034632DCF
MAFRAEDQAPASFSEVLSSYLNFYTSEWTGGMCAVDRRLEAEARGLLQREGAENSFTLLPFYPTVLQCLQTGACPHPQSPPHSPLPPPPALPHELSGLPLFLRASELLELICINLFLFPWRKEIRTLKKFSGLFVYYIKPGLPAQTTRKILQRIGYSLETDSEFILEQSPDPDTVQRMGFELFLARLECQDLLEEMEQKSLTECLEIIHKRSASPNIPGFSGNVPEEECQGEGTDLKEEVLEENKQLKYDSEPNPAPTEDQPIPKSLKSSNLDLQKSREPKKNSLSREESDDIREMRENYPDLAFRLKPIFKNSQTSAPSPNVKDQMKSKEPPSAQLHTVNADLSGPPSIALHSQSPSALRKVPEPLQSPEPQTSGERQPLVLRVGNMLKSPVFGSEPLSDDGLVTELTEKMRKLQTKDCSAEESLKFPVEETSQCQDFLTGEDTCPVSPRACSGSTAHFHQSDTIKEPPHSFYIPNCGGEYKAVTVSPTSREQNCTLQQNRSPTQQPEDELLQTYVML